MYLFKIKTLGTVTYLRNDQELVQSNLRISNYITTIELEKIEFIEQLDLRPSQVISFHLLMLSKLINAFLIHAINKKLVKKFKIDLRVSMI